MNRTLQDLRGDGLITLRNGSVTVLDWDRLKEAGESIPLTSTCARRPDGR